MDISFVSSAALAVTPNSASLGGYVAGGVGFSFVPSANLRVKKIGYRSAGNYNDPVIYFSSSNNVVGAYDFGYDIGPSNQMAYVDYPMDLNAGQEYSIGFFDTDLSSSFVLAELYFIPPTGGFIVAPQLTNYSSFTITTAGVFTNFLTNVFLLGANFTFEQAVATPRPVFTGIAIAGGNVTLIWESVSNRTYQVEFNTNLNFNNWNPLAPFVTASSNSATYTETFSDNPQRFYRVKLLP